MLRSSVLSSSTGCSSGTQRGSRMIGGAVPAPQNAGRPLRPGMVVVREAVVQHGDEQQQQGIVEVLQRLWPQLLPTSSSGCARAHAAADAAHAACAACAAHIRCSRTVRTQHMQQDSTSVHACACTCAWAGAKKALRRREVAVDGLAVDTTARVQHGAVVALVARARANTAAVLAGGQADTRPGLEVRAHVHACTCTHAAVRRARRARWLPCARCCTRTSTWLSW